MSINSDIRSLVFQQGVIIDLPVNALNDVGSFPLANNATTFIPNMEFNLNEFREIIIPYMVYRKTDAPLVLTQRGELRISARKDSGGADRWSLNNILRHVEGGTLAQSAKFEIDVAGDVAKLKATLNDSGGGGHECIFYYSIGLIPA